MGQGGTGQMPAEASCIGVLAIDVQRNKISIHEPSCNLIVPINILN